MSNVNDSRPGGEPFAAYPAADVLATDAQDAEPRRAGWAVVALAGALVLALVGGVSWAVGSLSGGGAQPEDALPAGAVAFVKVDLDPPAGQKIDGFRFLRKFPELRERIPLDGDVRKVLFEAFAEEAGWQDIDFEADVDPWLGDRLGVAAYQPDADQHASPGVVALQVTDAAEAEAGLRRLVDASRGGAGGAGSVGFVVSGDYALLAESQQLAELYAGRAADRTLADDERYASDVAELDDGVAAVWIDNAAISRAAGVWDLAGLGVAGVPGAGDVAGRTTLVARFDGPDVFEVVGSVAGADPAGWATHPVTGVGELPESTVLALGLADGDELAGRLVEAFRDGVSEEDGGTDTFDQMLAEAEQEVGVKLPEDLAVLLGDNLIAALDGTTDDGELQVAAKVRTDVDRAEQIIARLVANGPDAVLRTDAEHYVLGSSERHADRVLAGGGTLGEQPAFRQALPDLADADFAVWADPDGVLRALFGDWMTAGDPEDTTGLEPVAGVGLTASSREDGEAGIRFRIVAR